MYKFLLCWRYLRTRYIALASIISVMLGVATMIVVNSVMSGFTTEMQKRLHGILSDLTFEARGLDGMPDAEGHMAEIHRRVGDRVEGMTAAVVVPAMLNFRYGGDWVTKQVQLIGIDEATHAAVGDFAQYLQHPANRERLSFALREGGYDVQDHQAGAEAPPRRQMARAGWEHRRMVAGAEQLRRSLFDRSDDQPAPDDRTTDPGADPAPEPGTASEPPPRESGTEIAFGSSGEPSADPFAGRIDPLSASDPFGAVAPPPAEFDPATEQHPGLIGGIGMFSFRNVEGEDRFLVLPGDDVRLTLPTAGTPPRAVSATFTVVDFYESKMSEYDSNLVFVPIGELQQLRGMYDYVGGSKRCYVNVIQIKLKPGADLGAVRDELRAAFPEDRYGIYTWRDKQGPLLAAVQMETAILNVLLFLIIAVAGFGILAIFFMIVVEKTRDIGILKSLGAPSGGVMGIFLSYGLALGIVGSGVGMVLGLLFVAYINEIADVLGWVTGRPLFDPSIYYFYRIPAIVDPWTVVWIVVGALAIAVAASVLPALRAALLHPVEALRYE